MNEALWKPFYQKRGKYSDGRERICIAWHEKGKKKTLMLPKPEELKEILSVLFNSTQKQGNLKVK